MIFARSNVGAQTARCVHPMGGMKQKSS